MAFTSNGNASTTTATLSMPADGSVLTVSVGGQTFDLPQISGQQLGDMTIYEFGSTTGNGDIGMVMARQHSHLAIVGRAVNSTAGTLDGGWISVGGNTTSVMPTNITATYDGNWSVAVPQQMITETGASGLFTATVNLTGGANSINFNLEAFDATGLVAAGTGTGVVTGNSFDSTFNLTSGAALSSNNVTGNFYGPNAEEIGGIVRGKTAGNIDTGGFIMGTKRP